MEFNVFNKIYKQMYLNLNINKSNWLLTDIFSRRPRLDPELDTVDTSDLLDNSAAKHKLAVRPRKTHAHPKQGRAQGQR